MGVSVVAHRALLATQRMQDHRATGRVWRKANEVAKARWGDTNVTTTLHGRLVAVNFANPYPLALRRFPNYNAPQVELVALTAEALGRPVYVADVGAAVGDTALLLLERCGDRIKQLDCVEAELAFAELLEKNLANTQARAHRAVLSDKAGSVGSLVRSQHEGTASAEGAAPVDAITLDEFQMGFSEPWDVLKVDTDGFDGRILAGAATLLEQARPNVLFEWHPKLYRRLGNEPAQPFTVLRTAGYDRFVFFTKFGQFSHFGDGELERLADLCLHSQTLDDWHYDVAALHRCSMVDPLDLADLRHWGSSGWR